MCTISIHSELHTTNDAWFALVPFTMSFPEYAIGRPDSKIFCNKRETECNSKSDETHGQKRIRSSMLCINATDKEMSGALFLAA